MYYSQCQKVRANRMPKIIASFWLWAHWAVLRVTNRRMRSEEYLVFWKLQNFTKINCSLATLFLRSNELLCAFAQGSVIRSLYTCTSITGTKHLVLKAQTFTIRSQHSRIRTTRIVFFSRSTYCTATQYDQLLA